MKILVVEDEPVAGKVVEAVLRAQGHAVIVNHNGAEAWDTWLLSKPRVIISDWHMPEVDGLELCRRMRAERGQSYTYFLLLTARTGKESFLTAMDSGVDDFLTKPLDREELLARLRVAERILGLREEILTLEGLLPICSYCKRIRDGSGHYTSLERYISARSGAQFSHGVCPDCFAKYLEPELRE